MAGEIRIGGPTGATIYGNIFNAVSRRWNGSSFESFTAGNYANYAITLTEQGASGVFVGDFPTGITDAGDYEVIGYIQNGATPANGDPFAGSFSVEWNGSSVTPSEDVSTGEISGSAWLAYIVRTFKRTDKSTEVFEETNAAISEIRRKIVTARDEREVSFTDTISVLGDYKLDVETDLGMFVSDVFIRDPGDGYYLKAISKAEYDRLFGIWGSGSSERDRPRVYTVFGGQILLGPVPDLTTYEYVSSYSKANTTPVTSASTAIPYTRENYKEILRAGTLWRLFKLVENDDQAASYKAFWDDGLEQMKTLERRNRRTSTFQVAYNDI